MVCEAVGGEALLVESLALSEHLGRLFTERAPVFRAVVGWLDEIVDG